MASIKRAIVLKHRANLGEGAEDVSLEAGDTVTILKEWQQSYLVKNAAGQLFHVPKDLVAR
jgi:hypothetical protein